MKKYPNVLSIVFLILSFLTFFPQAKAQNRGEGAAIAAGAAVALVGGAILREQFIERLETLALNYILDAHPEFQSFRLTVLDLEGKKMSDIGDLSVLTFQITELDKIAESEISRSVLMLFTSSGWVNEYGLDIKRISWKLVSKEEWNDMFFSFVQLNTPLQINKNDGSYPRSVLLKKMEYNPADSLHYCLGSVCYKVEPDFQHNILESTFSREGLMALTPPLPYRYLTLPFFILGNDDYLVADYSEEFRLFSNEQSMGLFLQNTDESLQLQRSLVGKIHLYLNSD